MDLRSLSSLSEKRRSWSADVPLKKPEKERNEDEDEGKKGDTCQRLPLLSVQRRESERAGKSERGFSPSKLTTNGQFH